MATAAPTRSRNRPDFASRARSGPERRFITRDAAAVPPAEGSSIVGFRGHAIVYGEAAQIMDPFWGDSWIETIEPGACTSSIGRDDVRMLLNHDPNFLIARSRGASSDTLRLTEDSIGLACDADMDSRISYVRDLVVSLERGDISGMSFAFEVTRDEWDIRPDGMWTRSIQEVVLYDVSPVTYPAYDATDAQLRSFLGASRPVTLTVTGRSRTRPATRAGKRNSTADEAVIKSAIDRLGALVTEMQPLLESEQAEDDNDDDVAICQSTIEMANDIATDLQSLLDEESSEPNEEESARAKALARDRERHHRARQSFLGLAQASA